MRSFIIGMLACTIFCTLAMTALAAETLFPVPTRQYEVMQMEGEVEAKRSYYGELTGDPHMYELIAGEPFTLQVELAQAPFDTSITPLSYVIVEALLSGRVEEVGRVRPSIDGWKLIPDRWLGIDFYTTETFSRALPAGTYRIEVSSPENSGKYRLTTGTVADNRGYMGTWQTILAVNKFFDRSVFALLSSLFVQIQLLIAVVGLLLWKYGYPWWRRRQETHG